MRNNRQSGFTLLEILIALFIFAIISVILTAALRSVINTQEGTERNAERLRNLQFALLMVSRDVEQVVDRPVVNTEGKEEKAFIGDSRGFTLTHTGSASAEGGARRSALQRTAYRWNKDRLWRISWEALDQSPKSRPDQRELLTHVTGMRFEYLDQKKQFHTHWPLEANAKEALPRAVKIQLTISKWGSISQLYVIAAEGKVLAPPAEKH